MKIKSYIEKLQFDKYQLFYRQNKNYETVFIDIGEKSQLLNISNGTKLINEIVFNSNINNSFKLVEELNDKTLIHYFIQDEKFNYFPNRKISIYDSAMVFYYQGRIIDYLNISLKEKICRSKDNYSIDMSFEFVEKLASRLSERGFNPFNNYLPPSLSVMEQWRHYKFPFEFYKNPVFDIFESTINSGLFAINYKNVKIEIVPINGELNIAQLNKAKYIEENRGTTRKLLIDYFWEEYVKWKLEYELPELKNKEQLCHLVLFPNIATT